VGESGAAWQAPLRRRSVFLAVLRRVRHDWAAFVEKRMTRLFAAAACLGALVCLAPGGVSAAPPEIGLVPLPQSTPFDGGKLPLAAGSRIVAANPERLPLAGILSEEVALVAGVRLEVAQGQEKAGDIVLRLGEMPEEVSTSTYVSCLPRSSRIGRERDKGQASTRSSPRYDWPSRQNPSSGCRR